MAIILLVGPSNVGKSTLAGKASRELGLTHLDMDEVVRVRHPGFFERANDKILECLNIASPDYLLDFGAGFQNHDTRSYELFSPYKDRMITIWDIPENVFTKHPGRDFSEFKDTEYRKERMAIYGLSSRKLRVTSGDIIGDAAKFCDLITELISTTSI